MNSSSSSRSSLDDRFCTAFLRHHSPRCSRSCRRCCRSYRLCKRSSRSRSRSHIRNIFNRYLLPCSCSCSIIILQDLPILPNPIQRLINNHSRSQPLLLDPLPLQIRCPPIQPRSILSSHRVQPPRLPQQCLQRVLVYGDFFLPCCS